MKFDSPCFLAPMAGITDVAFRDLASRCGAGLTTTELVSAKGLLQGNTQTRELLRRGEEEKRFAVQLFGSEPRSLARATELVQSRADIVDLNAGCPVQKVCKTGAGCALLDQLDVTARILDAMLKVATIPVTVKMRIGLHDSSLALPFARLCEERGVSLLTVHGRTRAQYYSGRADWEVINEIVRSVSLPVVGNGDITSAQQAHNRLQCSPYVAIGRAASGNPYLFTQCNDLLDKGMFQPHSLQRQFYLFADYLELAGQYDTHFQHQLLQAQHFFKGVAGAAKLRLALSGARSQRDLLARIEAFLPKEK